MSGPFGSSQWMYSSGGFYPHEIGQSLRFNDDDSAYLVRTPSSSGNLKTYTQSLWLKRGNLSANTPSNDRFLSSSDNATGDYLLQFSASDSFEVYDNGLHFVTNAVYRDTSAWYHFVVSIDTTQATASDRVKIYVNGEQVTSFSTSNYPSQNADTYFNRGGFWHAIGAYFVTYPTGGQFFDGYLAEVNFIDGQALGPTDFGEFKSGVWVANEYTGSYGTNGFYLPFTNGIGDDESGNSNDWTANNLAATDIVLDSPTNNFATWNATAKGIDATLSEGNLKIDYGSATTRTGTAATFGMTSGKWYWEVLIQSSGSGLVGIANTTENSSVSSGIGYYPGYTSGGWGYLNDGDKYNNATNTSYGSTYTTLDIIGVAFDADVGTLTFYKNNTSQGDAFTSLPSATYFPAVGDGSAASTIKMLANFGQDSSFAGNKTAQGNTDDNGIGDFYYTPPSGYLALCTANLPDPVIDPAQDDVPTDYFNTVLYTGDGTTSNSVSGVGFQPDLVWLKIRDAVNNHVLYDAVRGVNNTLRSSTTDAESTNADAMSSFDADGFTVGENGFTATNDSGFSYVGWSWLAGNGTSSNTDGSITSTVSVNQKAGFSIVSYTGNGTAGATVGHGLDSAPEMIIVKSRSIAEAWGVYHHKVATDPETDALNLELTVAAYDYNIAWNDTAPTSSVFSIGTWLAVNGNGNNHIAYCFHSVEGYSKFGSYTGNGSTDGTFVYTGFRPAWVMIKDADASGYNWYMYDNKRETYNPDDTYLIANASTAEQVYSGDAVDFLSNGFKLRTDAGGRGTNRASSYIYMAFAENPFKYANAR